MIVFDLYCLCGYRFEGWFRDSGDFARQESEGLLVCPACEGRQVRKILAPSSSRTVVRDREAEQPSEAAPAGELAAKVLRSLQDYVIGNFEDVGTKLAEKALKMRYGLEKPRNIRGLSSAEEEKVLKREGIEIVKIPLPAKSDKN